MSRISISIKYPVYITSILIFIGLVISIINGFGLRARELQRMEEQYDHFKQSNIRMILKNLWLTDYSELQEQLDFIQALHFVDYIELTDEDGRLFLSGVYSKAQTLVYKEPLLYEYKNERIEIGTISAYYDYGKLDSFIYKEFFKLFAMILAAALSVSAIASILFNKLIGRHLKSLSDYLKKNRRHILKNKFSLKRKSGVNDELTVLTDAFNDMRSKINSYIEKEKEFRLELENEAEFRNRLLSIISHDLRGPLSSYSNLTESLIEEGKKEDDSGCSDIVHEIHQSSKALWLLTENLLDWTKGSSNSIELTSAVINPAELVEESEAIFSSMLSFKKITLEKDLDPEASIRGDRKTIGSVIRNIISNSIKFTPAGGVIHIGIVKSDSSVEIEITDNGTGISEEAVRNFYSGENIMTTRGTENEKGTGLGLALCSDFISLNNGSIDIERPRQGGTSVIIRLPAA